MTVDSSVQSTIVGNVSPDDHNPKAAPRAEAGASLDVQGSKMTEQQSGIQITLNAPVITLAVTIILPLITAFGWVINRIDTEIVQISTQIDTQIGRIDAMMLSRLNAGNANVRDRLVRDFASDFALPSKWVYGNANEQYDRNYFWTNDANGQNYRGLLYETNDAIAQKKYSGIA